MSTRKLNNLMSTIKTNICIFSVPNEQNVMGLELPFGMISGWEIPRACTVPNMFNICTNPDATVENCYENREWDVELRRSLSPREANDWSKLMNILQPIQLTSRDDEVEWALNKSKTFSTSSLYKMITHRGVCLRASENIWMTKLPLKIKVFMWQLAHNKLQSAAAISKRGWRGGPNCFLC